MHRQTASQFAADLRYRMRRKERSIAMKDYDALYFNCGYEQYKLRIPSQRTDLWKGYQISLSDTAWP